jgi:hypothetical protein
MALSTTSTAAAPALGAATRSRITLVCGALVLTALAAIPIGLAWPTVSDSGTVLHVGDIRPVRDAMWLLIMLSAVLGPLNVIAQAIAVLTLVREKAHLLVWQLPGHLVLTVGIVVQAVALFRARVLPRWVPTLTLAILLTYAFPGSGLVGLVSVMPLTAGCLAVAYFVRKQLTREQGGDNEPLE